MRERERGKARTCAGVVQQAFVPRWLRANALLTRHCWHSSMSGLGRQSIMGAYWWPICDGRWQQNMCSTGYMYLFRTLEFIWTKDPLVVLNASFIFFCSCCWGTKTNSITTLEKPMTKAINNRQELHWNKSISNPTKVDTNKKEKNGGGKNRTPFLSTGGQFLLANVIRGIVTVTVWYTSNKERIESVLNAEGKTVL